MELLEDAVDSGQLVPQDGIQLSVAKLRQALMNPDSKWNEEEVEPLLSPDCG